MKAARKWKMDRISEHIRPFDMRTDLLAVSNLVEVCFADRLSRDGKALLRKMRASAGNKRFQRWAHHVAGRVSMPFTGFVWVEGEEVVGNLSLIPYHLEKRDFYMIANVAVHPHYQRQGIGRALVRRALRFLTPRKADGIWLQVDEGNQVAIDLYREEGFREKTRRTTWYLDPDEITPGEARRGDPSLEVEHRQAAHWRKQDKWLRDAYPPEVRWHLPLKLAYLQGGFLGYLNRIFFVDPEIKQWSVSKGGKLAGVLSWQSSRRRADWIWLAAGPGKGGDVLNAFYGHLKSHHPFPRRVRLDYPAERAQHSLEKYGFSPSRTLIWMRHDNNPNE